MPRRAAPVRPSAALSVDAATRRRKPAAPALWSVAATLLLAAGCDASRQPTPWDCRADGESFRYRDGQRLAPPAAPIEFRLTIDTGGQRYEIADHAAIPELRDKRVVLDSPRSSAAESVYLLDATDPATGQRVVTSLVLNTVSGDLRLFHHRWTPPVEWRDSDQFQYTGHCRRR